MKKICLCLVLVMLITATIGCKRKEEPAPSKYKEYICSDINLVCIDVGKKYERETDRFLGGGYRDFTYYTPKGTSDDQFVCVTITDLFRCSTTYVLQNPKDLVDVWTDWTVREIQVYYPVSEIDPFSGEIARIPAGILASTTDAECIAQLIHCIASEETRDFAEVREEADADGGLYRKDLDGDSSKKTRIYIRVFFNESESIVWDSQIGCYRNVFTEKQYLILNKDDTIWDKENGLFGPATKEIAVENLPALEQFLFEALDRFSAEDLEK